MQSCLKGGNEGADTNPYLLPHPTAHKTDRGLQPHALSIIAANSLRLHIGRLGISNGPRALERAKNEIISLNYPQSIALSVRIQCWNFVQNHRSSFYGPIVSNFRQWEKSEKDEHRIILDIRAGLIAQQKAVNTN